MRNVKLVLFTLLAATDAGISAQDKPAGEPADPIAAALKKAQDEYTAAIEKAAEGMTAAFAAQVKKLEDYTKLDLPQQIKQLQAEQKGFEADPTALPKSTAMRTAASQCRTATAAARTKCAAGFDKAARDYQAKKDLARAKAVLVEKDEFLPKAGAPAADADQFKAGTVWAGQYTRIVNGTPRGGGRYTLSVISRDGQKFKARAELGNVAFEANGTIESGKVSWRTKDSVKIAGHAGHDYDGTLKGDRLDLTYSGLAVAGGGQPASGRVALKRSK